MAYGWISIHRKILDNWIWEDEVFSRGQAWIDLILLANHEDKKCMFNGSLLLVKRGSKVTSLTKLAERWKRSRKKVKKFMELLENDGMITFESDNKKTTYTICNYNVYQNEDIAKRTAEEPQKNIKGTSKEHQKNTNNNINNINNDNKDIYRAILPEEIYQKIIYKWNAIKEINKIDNSVIEYNKKSIADLVDKYGEKNLFKAIDKISESDWLRGLTDKSNWAITFKWFLNFDNFEKVLMDEYKTKFNQKPKRRSKPPISSSDDEYMEERAKRYNERMKQNKEKSFAEKVRRERLKRMEELRERQELKEK